MNIWLAAIMILMAFDGGFAAGIWWCMRPKLSEEEDDAHLGV